MMMMFMVVMTARRLAASLGRVINDTLIDPAGFAAASATGPDQDVDALAARSADQKPLFNVECQSSPVERMFGRAMKLMGMRLWSIHRTVSHLP